MAKQTITRVLITRKFLLFFSFLSRLYNTKDFFFQAAKILFMFDAEVSKFLRVDFISIVCGIVSIVLYHQYSEFSLLSFPSSKLEYFVRKDFPLIGEYFLSSYFFSE